MFILGVADGPDASAALVVDDQLVAVVSQAQLDGEHRSVGLPWGAIDAVLGMGGVQASEVDVVAVAGRFSPPLIVRQQPWLRKLVHSPFSPLLDLQVFWQAVLRHSGLGAYDADVAAEWLEERFAERGIRPSRLRTLDVHQCIAEAAYRGQDRDELLILGVHPMGDGVAVSVHEGRAGQLDRLWVQKGFASLHVHLMRSVAAMGLRPGVDERRVDGLSARGSRDPELDRLLSRHLVANGPRLSRVLYPVGPRTRDPVYARIRELSPEDAAASIHANLTGAICDLVRYHVRRAGIAHIGLAGEVFELPRLVARVAELDEVASVSVLPGSGRESLSVGAAASMAGLGPRTRGARLGDEVDAKAASAALTRARLSSVRRAGLADRLFRGEAVVRFRGRPGPGPIAQGARCVLVRGDDAVAIGRVREALGLPDDVEPTALVVPTPSEEKPAVFDKVRTALAHGVVAPELGPVFRRRYAPLVGEDGRAVLHRVEEADDPGLHQILKATLRGSGCGALAAFPLAEGDGPLVANPDHAVEIWRRAGFGAMQLGDHYLERDP